MVPHVVNISIYIYSSIHFFQNIWPPEEGTQLERASLVMYAYAAHWLALRKELIAPDLQRGSQHVCMSQYKHMYNSGRTPGQHKDHMNWHFKTESEGSCPSHVSVMCRGRLFTFDVLGPDGKLITAPEMERNLLHIRECADSAPHIISMAPLTTTNRTLWSERHQHLKEIHPENEKTLMMRETSIFTLTLGNSSLPLL